MVGDMDLGYGEVLGAQVPRGWLLWGGGGDRGTKRRTKLKLGSDKGASEHFSQSV